MIDFEHDKIYIAGAVLLAGVLLLMVKKKSPASDVVDESLITPSYGNKTLYVPTAAYEYNYNYGSQPASGGSATLPAPNGGAVKTPTTPVTPTTPAPSGSGTKAPATAPKPAPKPSTTPAVKWIKLNSVTSVFQSIGGKSDGSVKGSVKMKKDMGNGWYLIDTWLGERYIKPGYYVAQTKAHSIDYIVKSGDTLSKIGAAYHVDYHKIAKDNKIVNENLIKVGQHLTIALPN